MIANNRVNSPMIEVKDGEIYIRTSKMIDEILSLLRIMDQQMLYL